MLKLALVAFTLMCSFPAWSFPEMIRHGYTQCTACHVSPAGGGILTAYGRELAGELLSTWAYENESQFLHSKVGKDLADQGFLFGGDARALQYRTQDSQQLTGQLFLMHADFQGAFTTEHFTGVVSIGEIQDPTSTVFRGNFNSTMYYGFVRFNDELGVRAGRFDPAYGINDPDHTTVIKQNLISADPLLQWDTVEASYLSEHWTVLASAARTVDNTIATEQENVRTVNISYAFLNRMRVGASYWGGEGPNLNRHMYGVNGILGFTKTFYNLTEVDMKDESQSNSLYILSQLAYEIYRGIIPYIQYQEVQTNTHDPGSVATYYGAGFHFYPRPHFELSGEWDYVVNPGAFWQNNAWAMAHYYF